MTFDKGDVVILKSGGPALTVLEMDDEDVKCLYFSEEIGEFKKTTIPAFALEPFEDDEEEEDEEEDEEDSDEDEESEDEDFEDEDEEAKA